jgi:transposase InsO family protein
LRNISKTGPTSIRFKISIPPTEYIAFRDEVYIDLMLINEKDILHIVDTATRFSAATFLDSNLATYGRSVEGVWVALIETWFTVYTGYPNRLRVDAGSIFSSNRWKKVSDMTGIRLIISGVGAHNSLGIGERLHEPLRRIYKKVQMDYPHIPLRTVLKLTVKAMKYTIGGNGQIPSLIVFGVTPRYPALSKELPNQKERMEVISAAQREINSIIVELRIATALNKNIMLIMSLRLGVSS